MNNDKRQVLIVDDTAEDIHLLLENLKSEYAVLAATCGEKALELAANTPSLETILLDVEMPDMNGYEVCKRLKENPDTKNIDVIFVSAHDSTEEIMAGYEAGGCDYLIKPIKPQELLQKVNLSVQNRDIRRQAEKEGAAASVALVAMNSVGEQSVIMNFLRQVHQAKTFSELALMTVKALSQFKLDCCVQIRGSRELANAATRGSVFPLEEELLLRLKLSGRLKEMGKRLVANYEDISILVINMPTDEEERVQLRDHITVLLETVEIRKEGIELEQKISRVINDSNDALEEIEAFQTSVGSMSVDAICQMKAEIWKIFEEFSLFTEEQEEAISVHIEKGLEKAMDHRAHGDELVKKLNHLVSLIVKQLNE